MSLARLLFRTAIDVVLIVLITAAIAGPILYFDLRKFVADRDGWLSVLKGVQVLGIRLPEFEAAVHTRFHRAQMSCSELPADDGALEAWARALPGAEQVRAFRDVDRTVHLTFREPEDAPPAIVPWEQLGYRQNGMRSQYRGLLLEGLRSDQEYLLLDLGCLQLGILIVGLGRWGWNRYRRLPMLPFAASNLPRALVLGVALGLALATVAWLYDAGLRVFVGPTLLTTRAWSGAVIGLAPAGQAAVWVAVLLVGPMIHELYFRGVLFGSWSAAGRTAGGLIVSTLLSALARLDWYHFPLAILLGAALAEVFRRTRHLAAPVTAHVVVNTMLLGLLTGWLPGWPDLRTRIVGTWALENDPARTSIEFTDNGRLLVEQPPQPDDLFGPQPAFSISHYEFIGPDRIRIRGMLLILRVEDVVQVAIDGDVLTLTTVQSSIKGPGDVVRYRRVKR